VALVCVADVSCCRSKKSYGVHTNKAPRRNPPNPSIKCSHCTSVTIHPQHHHLLHPRIPRLPSLHGQSIVRWRPVECQVHQHLLEYPNHGDENHLHIISRQLEWTKDILHLSLGHHPHPPYSKGHWALRKMANQSNPQVKVMRCLHQSRSVRIWAAYLLELVDAVQARHVVGNINILDCNPMSDRHSSHPTNSRLSEQVLHASTDEFPIFLAPSDSQFRTPDFLLFSDAPTTRPTTFRLTATLSLSSSDSRSLSICRPTFLVVASRSQCLSAHSLSMSIVYKSTGA
jgi:hypothetical protein